MSNLDLPGNAGLGNQSTQDQQIIAATTALLVGSTISIPVGKLRAGTVFRFTLSVTKTNAGTAGNIFVFQLGTNGSVADADILTFTLPTATGVVDTAWIEILITIRGPLSSACKAQGQLSMSHNLQITGFATIPCVVINVLSGVFDATVANLIASLVCTTAASTVLTFQQVVAEAWNL